MKRFFSLTIAVALILVLSGCKSVESSGVDKGTQTVGSTANGQNNEKGETQKDTAKNETNENELQVHGLKIPHIYLLTRKPVNWQVLYMICLSKK